LCGGQIRDGGRKVPGLIDERVQPFELAGAMRHWVRGDYLFDKRRAGKRPAVGDRIQLRRAGKGSSALISCERRIEFAHGLKNLADRVVRRGRFRRGDRRALGPIHRLVEPIEILQRQRFRGERTRMRRRKGEKRMLIVWASFGSNASARSKLDRLSSSLSASCKMMPRLFQAAARFGWSAMASGEI
jgi:hypothetical protein